MNLARWSIDYLNKKISAGQLRPSISDLVMNEKRKRDDLLHGIRRTNRSNQQRSLIQTRNQANDYLSAKILNQDLPNS